MMHTTCLQCLFQKGNITVAAAAALTEAERSWLLSVVVHVLYSELSLVEDSL